MDTALWTVIGILAAALFASFGGVFYLATRIDALDERLTGRIGALDERLTGRIDALSAKLDTHIERHTA
jgi:hypothetical protein